MSIAQATFNSNTWSRFKESEIKRFYSRNKKEKNCFDGNLMILQNLETSEIVGVARLGKFLDGTTIHEKHLLDEDVYNGEDSKWNRQSEICISHVKVLNKPISYSDFAFLFGIDTSKWNNIVKNTHLNFSKLTYKSEDEETVIKKIKLWAESVL